ncbi:MalY/PatB family protein [Pectobacterium wasabiae]|uniref:cysteine-S-conjugate beta-lyase n=1 Tax=Pectobacterium wasabiae TaxID=55208 RepID=A0AAW3ECC7_9GAMM|nr:PatB family C-S lyase [Pectobacterium wasabiae]AOR65401.1 aminotransferase [Pectobacterium wasabiae CFBP 3304]EJS93167.1 Aminotransferase class I and II [Pectobacterium wasabiae CFBP 3304]KFX01456.1 aminotransferase [Pectobacterium wasabiae]KGA26341.1 aminotransferase [Pectobacterium wasabiae]
MSTFDHIIIRDANCRKYGQLQEMFGTDDLLPMWIADMDFMTPAPIINTLRAVVSQPIQGYSRDYPHWKESVTGWYEKRYGTQVNEEWLHFVPGVIKTIVISLMALSKTGDNILTCTPIYDPYPNFIKTSGRGLLQTRLVEKNGSYEFSWDDFTEKLNSCKIFLFSSPHNPGGIVWDKDTLEKINRYCHDAGVIVISDEVHCDLALPDKKHIPFFTVNTDLDSKSIVLTSTGKTFNTPAIQGGIALIKNEQLRNEFHHFLDNCYLAETNSLQQAAIYSAYTYCDEWHQKLLTYLSENVRYVKEELAEHCPLISVIYGGASFLVFLNASKLGLSDEQLMSFFAYKAKLGLSPGHQYGTGGEGHMRLNIGCPRAVLIEAITRLKNAYRACGFHLQK